MNFVLSSLMVFYFVYQLNCDNTTYTTKYDGIDLDEVLANDRLLAGYINCLLDKGPCTPDGKELKNNLPDAIENDCSKCTERQREGSDKVMHYIIDHKPEDWDKLEKKYNSDGTYKMKYLISKEKFNSESKENKNIDINGEDGDDDDDHDDDDNYDSNNKEPTPRIKNTE